MLDIEATETRQTVEWVDLRNALCVREVIQPQGTPRCFCVRLIVSVGGALAGFPVSDGDDVDAVADRLYRAGFRVGMPPEEATYRLALADVAQSFVDIAAELRDDVERALLVTPADDLAAAIGALEGAAHNADVALMVLARKASGLMDARRKA